MDHIALTDLLHALFSFSLFFMVIIAKNFILTCFFSKLEINRVFKLVVPVLPTLAVLSSRYLYIYFNNSCNIYFGELCMFEELFGYFEHEYN